MRASHGRLARAAIALAAAGGLLGSASPAFATDCANLQAALDAAPAASTVTIDAGLTCTGPYTLPPRAITLEGAGTGATIDGGGTSRALTGADVGATTIRNLKFQNGHAAGPGGAVSITGASTPSFSNSSFYANASDADGGALYIASTATKGTIQVAFSRFGDDTSAAANSATRGGALFIDAPSAGVSIMRSYVTGNRATDGYGGGLFLGAGTKLREVGFTLFGDNAVAPDSSGEAHGGGAFISVRGPNTTEISENVFERNVLEPASAVGMGAGLEVRGEEFTAGVKQFGNIFRGNAALDDAPAIVPALLAGGGEAVNFTTLTSEAERFVDNALGEQAGAASGAGIFLTGCLYQGTMTFRNAVLAGNEATGSVAGPAIGASCGAPVVSLTIQSSTITANLPASVPAIAGDASDLLTATNSILTVGGSGATDISGFTSRSITFSDACNGGSVHTGTGNMCTPPGLVDKGLGMYVQLRTGPTVDAGSNSLVPSTLRFDVEFVDPRILDGDLNGSEITDMGADEFNPFRAPPEPPAPTPDPIFPPFVPPPAPAAAPEPDPEPAQVVAGERTAAPRAPRKCGDKYGPTSRFINRLSKSATLSSSRKQLVFRGRARFKKCPGGTEGRIKRVNFTVRLVDGKRCRLLTKKRRLGRAGSCKKTARLVRAKGRGKWSITLGGRFPDGRYLAQVQAVDNLGNKERASRHRNFRHFRIDGGKLRQGWHGDQPDDYTKRPS